MGFFVLLLFYSALTGCPFEIIGEGHILEGGWVAFCEDSEYAPGSAGRGDLGI